MKTSRRSLVISAAALPALAVPTVAGAAVNPDLLALGERLRVLLPKTRALGAKSRRLNEECRADLPIGFALQENFQRIYELRAANNGRYRAYAEWNDASTELNEIANAILDIPATDRIGEGIRAAAALALDEPDCGNGFNMRAMLWAMAERAGFVRSECENPPKHEVEDDDA